MSLVDQVAADARTEFLSSVASVIGSIDQLKSKSCPSSFRTSDVTTNIYRASNCRTTLAYEKIRHDAEQSIRRFLSDGNNIYLNCTQDVLDLLDHLFSGNELLNLGFAAIRVIQTRPPHQRTRSADTTDPSRSYELYLIRPTFADAALLKTALSYDRSECFVLCLPGISEMFPDVLQGVLGNGFTVSCGMGKQTGNRIVHLFNCNVHMAPVETCALSMFLSQSFESFYTEGDPMASWFFTRAMEHLESRMFDGVVNIVTCLGHLSKFAGEILVNSRRDCAAELIIRGTARSSTASDMPFLTRDLRRTSGDHIDRQGSPSGLSTTASTSSNTTTDTDHMETRMRLLRQSPIVDEAVLIDRRVDMVTPMCLNFTYEGLIDNILGVVNSSVVLPQGVVEGSTGISGILEQYRNTFSQNTPEDTSLAATDSTVFHLKSPLYRELRWLNYSEVGKHLHQRALQVHKGYERGDLATLDEMDAFVKKFKNLQKEHSELSVHVNLMSWLSSVVNGDCTQLLHQLEDSILQSTTDVKLEDSKLASITAKLFNKTYDPCVALFLDLIFWNVEVHQVYRLLVLLSQTRDGVKPSDLHSIKRAIVDQYGFSELLSIQKLENMGLITANDSPDGLRWSRLCKKLNLLVDRDTSTSDYAVIFGGYAPISVRLFQLIVLARNVSSVESELRLLDCPVSVLRQKSVLPSNARSKANSKLLGFLGGVTLGEIAAVASLNQKRGDHILILATNVVSMKSMLTSGI